MSNLEDNDPLTQRIIGCAIEGGARARGRQGTVF